MAKSMSPIGDVRTSAVTWSEFGRYSEEGALPSAQYNLQSASGGRMFTHCFHTRSVEIEPSGFNGCSYTSTYYTPISRQIKPLIPSTYLQRNAPAQRRRPDPSRRQSDTAIHASAHRSVVWILFYCSVVLFGEHRSKRPRCRSRWRCDRCGGISGIR